MALPEPVDPPPRLTPDGRVRKPTSTSAFGASRRESHDASAFYERFVAPEISDASAFQPPTLLDQIHRTDARDMAKVESDSVALVVTSPPYFAGKEYEETLGEGGVPASYFEYLEMLRDVFAECARVLEPGGRVAVNVANLGRKPYRSLSADITTILQDLGLLLRGEVIWWKGKAAGGSCAWGSFQRPTNPVLRDVTERIVIASKGRFDRARTARQRAAAGQPSTSTISREEFMEATTDLWEMAPESATRVGHPAPFPVELPRRLIDLYTYKDDVVLDPFMGSGTTAVAAVRTGRHYVGFETDDAYADRAEARIQAERDGAEGEALQLFQVELPAVPATDIAESEDDPSGTDFQARGVREGRQAKEIARRLLEACGFDDVREDVKPPRLGIELNLVATDKQGHDWAFDVSGAFTSTRAGLKRTDTLWKALGKAAVLHSSLQTMPLVLLTTDAPVKGSAGDQALHQMLGPGKPIVGLVELLDAEGQQRLRAWADEGPPPDAPSV
jgi:site-specific DNA-methyltransferase (adenine-specific)